ncbi:MAG: RING finger protein [Porcipelethomonas sp.]
MANYNGAECLICKKKFSDDDDIVVCPECGTPYHRDCYLAKGECVNGKLHESGGSWKRESSSGTDDMSQDAEKDGEKICRMCGASNKAHSLICEKCGSPMIGNNQEMGVDQRQYGGCNGNGAPYGAMNFNPDDKFCGMNPDEEFEGVKLSEVSEFVGKNRYYYLPMFKRMKDTGKSVSFNFVCLFFPQLYFANRKMWLFTVLTTLISFVLSVPTLMYYMADMNLAGAAVSSMNFNGAVFVTASRLTYYLNIAFTVLMCLFANKLYYHHVLKKVRQLKNMSGGAGIPEESMQRYGGTSTAGIIMTLLVQFVITFILMLVFKIC